MTIAAKRVHNFFSLKPHETIGSCWWKYYKNYNFVFTYIRLRRPNDYFTCPINRSTSTRPSIFRGFNTNHSSVQCEFSKLPRFVSKTRTTTSNLDKNKSKIKKQLNWTELIGHRTIPRIFLVWFIGPKSQSHFKLWLTPLRVVKFWCQQLRNFCKTGSIICLSATEKRRIAMRINMRKTKKKKKREKTSKLEKKIYEKQNKVRFTDNSQEERNVKELCYFPLWE